MELEVKGSYRSVSLSPSLRGDFHFVFYVKGGLEEDGADYIFYRVANQLSSLQWEEVFRQTATDQASTVVCNELVKLETQFDYVTREKKRLVFSFSVKNLNLSGINQGRILRLPQTNEYSRLHPEFDYDNHIVEGSNRIEFKNRILRGKSPLQQSYSWSWRYRTGLDVQEHDVSLRILVTQGKSSLERFLPAFSVVENSTAMRFIPDTLE